MTAPHVALPVEDEREVEVIDRYGARWRYKRAEGYSWAFGVQAGTNDIDDINMVEVWHEDADGDIECVARFPYAAMVGYVTENTAHNLNLREMEPEWAREIADLRSRLSEADARHERELSAMVVATTQRNVELMQAGSAYAVEMREAIESVRDGLINLRPESGPMHRQMTKHIVTLADILNVLGPGLQPVGSTQAACSSAAGGMEVANPREDSPLTVLVPREPTDVMIRAAAETPGMREVDGAIRNARVHGVRLKWDERGEDPPIVQAWKAMIATVPDAPRTVQRQEET